jgi:hypothetical protein
MEKYRNSLAKIEEQNRTTGRNHWLPYCTYYRNSGYGITLKINNMDENNAYAYAAIGRTRDTMLILDELKREIINWDEFVKVVNAD